MANPNNPSALEHFRATQIIDIDESSLDETIAPKEQLPEDIEDRYVASHGIRGQGKEDRDHDTILVDWDGPYDPENPKKYVAYFFPSTIESLTLFIFQLDLRPEVANHSCCLLVHFHLTCCFFNGSASVTADRS